MTCKVCRQCNKSLPNNRLWFKRCKNSSTGKECLTDICKKCIYDNLHKEDWSEDKLLCHICLTYLDPSCFDKNKSCKHRNGLDKRCKSCKKYLCKLSKLRRDELNKLLGILNDRRLGARSRSNKKGWKFDLTTEDLLDLYYKQNGKCALSGIQMTNDILSGRTPTNVSLDRIDSSKPYTKENIQLVCMAINQMKSDLTTEQLIYFCTSIINKQKK